MGQNWVARENCVTLPGLLPGRGKMLTKLYTCILRASVLSVALLLGACQATH